MKPKERLVILKDLDRGINEPFKSQEDCINWANKVAPFLRFNPQYYETFMYHANIINIPTLSGNTYGMSVKVMVSTLKQAITELEYNLTQIKEITSSNQKESWHAKPSGVLILGIIASLIAALIWWKFTPFFDDKQTASSQSNQSNIDDQINDNRAKLSATSAPFDLTKSTKYFPLSKGNYWIYSGETTTCDKSNNIVTKKVTIKMQILDVVESKYNKGVKLFIMKGHPSEAANLDIGENNKYSIELSGELYGYLVVSNKIYHITNDMLNSVKDAVRNGESLQNLKSSDPDIVNFDIDDLVFEFPLFRGQRIGDSKQITRDDLSYFWYVNDAMNYRSAENGIVTQNPKYELTYITRPDSVSMWFEPYVGITYYEYSHHGSRLEAKVELINHKLFN